jgi:endonuclease G, mitochondrial
MTDQGGARERRVRSFAGLANNAVDRRAGALREPIDPAMLDRPVGAGRPTRYFLLEASRAAIDRTIAAVGRVELHRGDGVQSLGSAWLVRDDIAVTNRHVAAEFRETVPRGEVMVSVDFLAERDVDESRERRVVGVDLVEGHDLAFFRLAADTAGAPPVIALSEAPVAVGQGVCTIGYPSNRLAHYDPVEARRRFSEPFDVKRLAPGRIVQVRLDRIDHDCATLSGNSGGVLLDVASGEAVGLHYGGERGVSNYSVPVAIVREWLARLV